VNISPDTQFARFGQPLFRSGTSGVSDLVQGSLVSVKFQPQKPGQAVASAITVLAVPGSTFEFSGSLVSIDLHAGRLEMVDPTDQKDYQISFSATRFPASRDLHPGDRVHVSAKYNGTGFVATEVAAN
jgi:cold shock CspA family protein